MSEIQPRLICFQGLSPRDKGGKSWNEMFRDHLDMKDALTHCLRPDPAGLEIIHDMVQNSLKGKPASRLR